MTDIKCPCCSGLNYSDCCQLLHGGNVAKTPEQLMRSRYSAFALSKIDYLWNTSSNALQKNLDKPELAQTCQNFQFVSLRIIGADQDKVEFIADLLFKDELHPLHETSTFILQHDHWKYDSGVIHPSEVMKVKRNDKCPCGSGKKFKQCHLV